MLKLLGLLGLSLCALSACSSTATPATGAVAAASAPASAVTPAIRTAVATAVSAMAPGVTAQSITPTPIAGLYQVIAQGQVLYMTADGRYVIQGNAFDVKTRTPLTRNAMDDLRRSAIAKLVPGQMIRFAPPHPKYTVTVFTDVDCPYCRSFHANIAAVNKLGIAVDYLFWPRTGLHTPSAQKAVDVWCAKDQKAAMTAAFEGATPTPATCASPVARDFKLGVDLGVGGTPTIIADNGVVLGGYVDPQELLRRLEEIHAPQRGDRG